jgi:hypothetical protein
VAGVLKSDKPTSFMGKCLAGEASPSDIDDFVDQWHEGSGEGSLRAFLGFTKEEYALWVEQPQSLDIILFARMRHLNLRDVVKLCFKRSGMTKKLKRSRAKTLHV